MEQCRVRWFYSNNGSHNPFSSYDTVRLERAHRTSSQVIAVRNGMFTVDLLARTCSPIYDRESKIPVVRGIWFYSPSHQPVPEWLAQQLEEHHNFLLTQNTETPWVLELEDYVATWDSMRTVVVSAKSPPFVTSIMQRIGLTDSSSPVVRGYHKIAREDTTQKRISHLVFIVPGIAQSQDHVNAAQCCLRLRKNIKEQVRCLCPENKEANIEFIPINWRSIELGERTLEAIMPNANIRIRNFLNNSLLDVLYYSSAHFRNKIIGKLSAELSRLYSVFLDYHGGLDPPKVSIVAHSLGSVIVYDLITHQSTCPDPHGISPPTEDIHISNLFMIGSPLAIFLMLRGFSIRDSSTTEDMFPHSGDRPFRLFNIFFPSDFMAYRLEPMFCRDFRHVDPVRLWIESDSSELSDSSKYSIDSVTQDEYTPWYRSILSSISGFTSVLGDSVDMRELSALPEGLEYRLDFALYESNFGISRFITSHLCYWDNVEFASFVVKRTIGGTIYDCK